MDDREIDLLKKVREHIQRGTYFLSQHAVDRKTEQAINLPDILFVLELGHREKVKDSFDTKRQTWKYAIRGKTSGSVGVRVIVAVEETMVIITVMRIK